MALVRAAVASVPLTWTIPAPVLLLALRSATVVAVFSPVSRIFRACLGTSVLSQEFSLLFLGYAYGVAFFAPSVSSPLLSILQWLAFCVLAAGPHLWWSLCVCGVSFFLWRRSCVFFPSSCWVWGRFLLSLFWCGCGAFSWGTCGFPQRVLQLATLLGFHI